MGPAELNVGGLAGGVVGGHRAGIERFIQEGRNVTADHRTGTGNGRVGTEVRRIDQFGTSDGGVGVGGLRIFRQVGAVIDRRARGRRQERTAELQRGQRAADRIAGRRIDRNALEIISGAVHQIAVLVQREIAATGIEIGAGELQRGARTAGRRLDGEEAVAADRHIGADRSAFWIDPCTLLVGLDCALTPPAVCWLGGASGIMLMKLVSIDL